MNNEIGVFAARAALFAWLFDASGLLILAIRGHSPVCALLSLTQLFYTVAVAVFMATNSVASAVTVAIGAVLILVLRLLLRHAVAYLAETAQSVSKTSAPKSIVVWPVLVLLIMLGRSLVSQLPAWGQWGWACAFGVAWAMMSHAGIGLRILLSYRTLAMIGLLGVTVGAMSALMIQ